MVPGSGIRSGFHLICDAVQGGGQSVVRCAGEHRSREGGEGDWVGMALPATWMRRTSTRVAGLAES